MNDFITTYDEWYEEYKKNRDEVWIIAHLTDDRTIYFNDFAVWLKIKDLCESDKLFVKKIQFQFRSHIVDANIGDCEGVYLIRCVKGMMGGESRDYYVVGEVISNLVYKDMWLTPELFVEESFEDTVDNCFEEAIIYQYDKGKI
tara:strand:- start:14313 stop:14744 length:432 start_codon:yes stop_codon:yes gene_type:complete